MGQTQFVNLPIIGRIQHGEQIESNGVKKVKEYGHFILKIEDEHMKPYLQKFDQMYKGKKSIDIVIFNEEPLNMKYVRFNQGGQACSCNVNLNIASQKTNEGWKKIECNESCKYRQKDSKGKSACNRIGWIKFLVPSICKDRIFLMKITGQTSLNRLSAYFSLQKALGKSLVGHYTLFLKQEEQSNMFARSFNHYILDILNKEDFISTETIPEEKMVPKIQDNVNDTKINSSTEKKKKESLNQKDTIKTTANKKSETIKENTKKQKKTKTQTQKNEESPILEQEQTKVATVEDFNNYYVLCGTSYEKLKNKAGEENVYLIGQFSDMEDNISNIVIRPDDSDEVLECDIGSIVQLDVKNVGERKFAIGLNFIDKRVKKVVA